MFQKETKKPSPRRQYFGFSHISHQTKQIASSIGLGILASLTLALPARSEGSQQLGVGSNGLNVYLFEYDANNSFIQSPYTRPIYVNVENANDVINISLCGWNYNSTSKDDLAIEVFRPGGTEIDYSSQVVSSPGSFSSSAGSGSGAWLLTEGNAKTETQTTLCTHQGNPSSASGVLTNPVRFKAPEAGTYEIRLYNDSQSATSNDAVFTYFDITVTSSTSTNPNPAANNGQLWATSWAFNAGNTFGTTGGYDANLYIRTPGGRTGTEFIWQLDLNQFAPQRHEIIANSIGLNSPYSRYSVLGTLSPTYTRSFAIYLSPPNSSSTVAPILPEPAQPTVSNVRFIDSAGEDNSISPNATSSVQDSGYFKFDTDVAGTYEIIIDTNKDGSYGQGDRVLFGTATSGTNSVLWDGKGFNNATLSEGTYNAQVMVRIGEYHFVTYDAETSGGGSGNGLSIWKWNSSTSSRSQVLNYWDDASYLSSSFSSATTNLTGGLSGTSAGSHTWGSFTSGSIGDTNFMDTWVFGGSQQLTTQAIIANVDNHDFGDAPDTYGTNKDITTGGTPASHLIKSSLRLGTTTTDADTDGQPTTNADGDDTNPSGGTDDENGVSSFSTLAITNTSYSVSVRVRNTTGQTTYLVGWIDFNRNGTFEESEGVAQTVANNTNANVTLSWTGLSGIKSGTTYARFRLNQDSMTASNPTGGGTYGEVEDYTLTITSIQPKLLLVKRITAINNDSAKNPNDNTALNVFVNDSSTTDDDNANWPTPKNTYLRGAISGGNVKPGDEVEYTIYFLNTVTAAKNVTICDLIPTNQTFVETTYSSTSGIGLALNSSALPTTPNTQLTNAADTDAGRYYPPGDKDTPTVCKKFDSNGTVSGKDANTDGAIAVKVVTGSTSLPSSTAAGTPTNSYGFIRFRAKVN